MSVMARRPNLRKEDVLTPEDLAALRRRLSMLSEPAVKDFYRGALLSCGLEMGHFPQPRAIQELVTAYKMLRRWR